MLFIFIKCDFCEESGHGVPTVVEKYGIDSYEFMDNFIDVTIPFDKTGFEGQNGTQNGTQKVENKTTEDRIIEMIMSNNKITRKQMSNELNIPVRTLQRIINSIDRIEYVGSAKSGHWEIK